MSRLREPMEGLREAFRTRTYSSALGYGAFEGGAALLPMTITIMVLMVLVAPP